MSTAERLLPVLRAALTATPYVVEDVTITPAGRRSVVRVVIDRQLADLDVVTAATPTISLDEVAEATRAISAVLDEHDVLGQTPYTLEVTSPGVSRPLTQATHFQRNVGRLVRVIGTDLDLTGRLVEAGRTDLVLDLVSAHQAPPERRRIALEQIGRGEVQIEFNRAEASEDDADETLTEED